jgi:CarD family transcriptional regulator
MAQKNKVPAKARSAKATGAKRKARAILSRKAVNRKTVSVKARASTKTKATQAQVASRKEPAKKPAGAARTAPAAIVRSGRTAAKAVAQAAAKLPVVSKPVASGAAKSHPAVQAIQAKRTAAVAAAKPGVPKFSGVATPKDIAARAAEARQQLSASKRPVSQRHGFKTNEYIVYPAHGVGRIIGIEEQEIAGMALELFVITFEKDKMTLRVPTGKLQSVGMRKLSEDNVVKRAMDTLKGRARIKRTMWSRRAQEYEAKINSGDLVSIAEVVRDLYRSESQPEQSYSERQLYEAALDRMAREIAAVDKLDERGAVQRITEVLSKSARGRRMAAEGAGSVEAEVKAA